MTWATWSMRSTLTIHRLGFRICLVRQHPRRCPASLRVLEATTTGAAFASLLYSGPGDCSPLPSSELRGCDGPDERHRVCGIQGTNAQVPSPTADTSP